MGIPVFALLSFLALVNRRHIVQSSSMDEFLKSWFYRFDSNDIVSSYIIGFFIVIVVVFRVGRR
jgi:hypothetical protein